MLVATTACSVRGTDIKPVAPTPPTAFESADTALASTEPVDAWWTTFQDARMTSLVEQALGRSPDVRQATALVRLARARLREQEGANWPLGGVTAAFERSRSQIGVAPTSDVNLFDAGVDASWEVDVFGARRAAIAGARADFARERSLRRLTLVSVAAEVVLAYTDVRGTQARLAVARDNVANQESASELTQQLLTAGRGTQLDVDRAIALLESTRASIPPLLAAESSAIYRLGVLVGAEPQALAADLRVPATAAATTGRTRDRRTDHTAAPAARRGGGRICRARRCGSRRRRGCRALPTVGAHGRSRVCRPLASATSTIKGCGLVSESASPCRFSNGTAFVNESWPPMRPPRSRSRTTSELPCPRSRKLSARSPPTFKSGYASVTWSCRRGPRARPPISPGSDSSSAPTTFLPVLDAERVRLDAEDRLAQSRVEVTRQAASIFKALGGGWSEAERLTSAQLADDDRERLRRIVEVGRK